MTAPGSAPFPIAQATPSAPGPGVAGPGPGLLPGKSGGRSDGSGLAPSSDRLSKGGALSQRRKQSLEPSAEQGQRGLEGNEESLRRPGQLPPSAPIPLSAAAEKTRSLESAAVVAPAFAESATRGQTTTEEKLRFAVTPRIAHDDESRSNLSLNSPSPEQPAASKSLYKSEFGIDPRVSKSKVPADLALRGGIRRHRGSGLEAKLEDTKIRGEQLMSGLGPGNAGDRHEPIEDNPFLEPINAPLSTFSVDVDTAAYAKVRMYLMQQGAMPRPAAVRIEELVNYFRYDYAPPTDEHPFAATMDIAECPWNPEHRLARIGIKGKIIEKERPSSNLVFLLDVSGSMNQPNKLPLVIDGMKMLTDQLTENDSVAIVVYAGAAGLVLDSTNGDEKQTIVGALERLKAGGSTNGGQGIQLAYQIARDHFITGGTNRVILCSDGDFNVGVTGTDQLVDIAKENARGNIYLSVLGFGMGNHNDAMMEKISNDGNGNYAFIDSKSEARKVLVEEMGGTLVTIAKDVKIQVEFNPLKISAYRLIGYENRILAAQDFNDDTKDAGEIGAGHTVTALYELVPADGESELSLPSVDDLRYQKKSKPSKEARSNETLTLKLRYKAPDSEPDAESTLIQFPVSDSGKGFSDADTDFQFAASVAAFGMLLRNSPHKGDATFAAVEEIATGGAENDSSGYRAEFIEMVRKAASLRSEQ